MIASDHIFRLLLTAIALQLVIQCQCQSINYLNNSGSNGHNNDQKQLPAYMIIKHGLKFQNQLENVTLVKRPGEQQIFKCQVRLAPLSQQLDLNHLALTKLNWSISPLDDDDNGGASGVTNNYYHEFLKSQSSRDNNNNKLPIFNVSLSIDWLMDGQSICKLQQYEQSIQITNVTLKTSADTNGLQQQFDKSFRNKTLKIEIKNTHNGGQFKLTSRLKINRLSVNDSGSFKCLARVSYKQFQLQLQHKPTIILVNQSLGSQESQLIVRPNTGEGGDSKYSKTASTLANNQMIASDGIRRRKFSATGKHYHQQQNHHHYQDRNHLLNPSQMQDMETRLGKTGLKPNVTDNNNDIGSIGTANKAVGGPGSSETLSGGSITDGNSNDNDKESYKGDGQESTRVTGASDSGTKVQNNQFEDDEDLYGLDLRIISDQEERLRLGSGVAATSDVASGGDNNEEEPLQQPANDNQLTEASTIPLAGPEGGQNVTLAKVQPVDASRGIFLFPVGPNLGFSINNGDGAGGHNIQWVEDLGVAPMEYSNGNNNASDTTGDEITSYMPTSGLGTSDNESSLGRQANEHNVPSLGYLGSRINANFIKENSNVSISSSAGLGSDPSASPSKYQHRLQARPHSRIGQTQRVPSKQNFVNNSSTKDSITTSTNQRIARLVHSIAPAELSFCYTNLGEDYRGSVATSLDQRPCLNWLNVRLFRFHQVAIFNGGERVFNIDNQLHHQDNHHNRNSSRQPAKQQQYQQPQDLAGIPIENHNHCRNFNLDLLGPWCFVAYDEDLDGLGLFGRSLATSSQTAAMVSSSQQFTTTPSRNPILIAPSLKSPHGGQQLYIARQCNISPCSDYLWLYIVAPPIGLLLLLTCILGTFVRSMRKTHRNAIFSAQSPVIADQGSDASVLNLRTNVGDCNQALPGPNCNKNKLTYLQRRRKGSCCKQKRQFAFKNDDIYDIVDDIDFSDGLQTQTSSLSPKSGESFKLNHSGSSFSSSASQMESLITTTSGNNNKQSQNSPPHDHYYYCHNNNQPAKRTTNQSNIYQDDSFNRPKLAHCRSINPIFDEKALGDDDELNQADKSGARCQVKQQHHHHMQLQRGGNQSSGPMFATLRCPARAKKLAAVGNNLRPTLQQNQLLVNKSSSFIIDYSLNHKGSNDIDEKRGQDRKQCGLGKSEQLSNDWMMISASTRLKSKSRNAISNLNDGVTTKLLKSDQLLVDSKSNDELISCLGDGSNEDTATALSQENGDHSRGSFRLANELPQINSNSVTIAYDKQPLYEGKFSQVQVAYLKQKLDDSTQATGLIGAQVAVCSLKSQTAIDESVFELGNLKLLNLNHLNLLKLIGWVDLENRETNSTREKQQPIALVYDMAHLIDLSDWLKEQNRDSIIGNDSNQSEPSLRQNLTCFAKQIALALDYLHDRNIIFKDLACRNCFIDVTKMLIKLASFNVELEVDQSDSEKLSLKSMIRPKYLLDYYVIDSRPSEGQLLPLSWIPLESILFNKFNEQTDIWSFGCLLYELFSLGEVAYFGYSSKQVIDSIRSNLMPPKPLLCPNGIYKIICKCLSDIPTLRPNVKQIYEQLNLYGGQCSSFLDHHLCSLA